MTPPTHTFHSLSASKGPHTHTRKRVHLFGLPLLCCRCFSMPHSFWLYLLLLCWYFSMPGDYIAARACNKVISTELNLGHSVCVQDPPPVQYASLASGPIYIWLNLYSGWVKFIPSEQQQHVFNIISDKNFWSCFKTLFAVAEALHSSVTTTTWYITTKHITRTDMIFVTSITSGACVKISALG